jgi:beta-galactosidase
MAQNNAPRTVISLNEAWEFTKDSIQWQPIHLPHTWNADDVVDDEPGYYRAVCWYRKKLVINPSGRQVYLRFEGANQLASVFVNGKVAGTHTGGYTAFQLPIHELLRKGEAVNEIIVRVDNRFNEQVPPLSADFTFFGGIYRDAWLVTVPAVHFSLDDHGSNGLYITTPCVSEEKADIHLRGTIVNNGKAVKQVYVSTIILNKEGKAVKQIKTVLSLKPQGASAFSQSINDLTRPHLWSPGDPYLYTVKTVITDASSGKVMDELNNPLGFRWFHFDAEKGFFLNGKPCKLVGASRHQDRPGMGNAVPDELARQDIEWLKKMGGNFLRVAHYPQDPSVLEACDKLGILASVEIPIVNEITESDSFFNNCIRMQVEMIRQHFNHPSIILWCYMNEVLLRPHFNNDKGRQKKYFANITRLAVMLDSITRQEDPYRYTMIANHGNFDLYRDTKLTNIPMVVGWNLYSGWYGGEMKNFPEFLDRHRLQLPLKPMVVAEYGADADPRIRSFQPVRFDKSVEYATQLHQYYLQEMFKRPFVAGAMVWNLADFNSETREETMPHINNKGLLTGDRTPKDVYFFYQAMLASEPYIKVVSCWQVRSGVADSGSYSCRQPIQVASNLDSVQLIVNGRPQAWRKPEQRLCEWNIPFENGLNIIQAKGMKNGKQYIDRCSISFRLLPYNLKDPQIPFEELNILLGANRYFIENKEMQVWQPDQPYISGGWGHMDGRPFKMEKNTRLPYGTDKDIRGTFNDPVYQTQLSGITGYRLDVPAGKYEVTLHFAELQNSMGKDLPYNLSGPGPQKQTASRNFNVYVNGQLLLENFNIAVQYGVAVAVSKKMIIVVKEDEGIQLSFVANSGEAVLNGLQVRRVY